MKVTAIPGLGSYGAFVDGLDFTGMDDETWDAIGRLYLDKLVVILRDTGLDRSTYYDWIVKWGPTRSTTHLQIISKYGPEVFDPSRPRSHVDPVDLAWIEASSHIGADKSRQNLINVSGMKTADGKALGMFQEGELLWHSNESGTLTFVANVALLGSHGVVGTATGFVTSASYYESLSESFRSELDDMVALHRFTPGKINPGLNDAQDHIMYRNMCPVDDVEVPLVCTSPGGIRGLHYPVNTIHRIKGMSEADSRKVFDELDRGLFVEEYIYDHWYKNNGDVLLFDQSITLHRRLGDVAGRLCHRITFDFTRGVPAYNPYDREPYRSAYAAQMAELEQAKSLLEQPAGPRARTGHPSP